MGTTNYKTKLQEYLQKKDLELPIYTYIKIGQGWKAKLELPNSDKIYFGEIFSSKVKSAQSSAQKAFEELVSINSEETDVSLEQKPIDSLIINKSRNPIYILVDFENVPHIDKLEIFKEKYSQITLIKFASINNSKVNVADYVIPTTAKDATDHFIGVYLGMLIATIQNNLNVLIITKDHFGEVFEIIYGKLNNPNINVKHFTNQEFTLEYITSNYQL